MSALSGSRGKSPSGTSGLFNLAHPVANRSPSPAIRRDIAPDSKNLFNLHKKPETPGRPSDPILNNILTTTSQPKSGIIPGARIRLTGGARARSPSATSRTVSVATPEIIEPGQVDQIEAHNPRISDAEIKNLLVGYVSLPKKYWRTGLVYRQHIRYVRLKDNIFVRGGFISGIGKQRGKDTLSLVNCFNSRKPGYYAWVINLDALKAIFIRRQDWDELKKTLN